MLLLAVVYIPYFLFLSLFCISKIHFGCLCLLYIHLDIYSPLLWSLAVIAEVSVYVFCRAEEPEKGGAGCFWLLGAGAAFFYALPLPIVKSRSRMFLAGAGAVAARKKKYREKN